MTNNMRSKSNTRICSCTASPSRPSPMTAAEMRLDSCGDAARAMLDSCGDVRARYEAPAARHFSFPVKRGPAVCPDLVKGRPAVARWRPKSAARPNLLQRHCGVTAKEAAHCIYVRTARLLPTDTIVFLGRVQSRSSRLLRSRDATSTVRAFGEYYSGLSTQQINACDHEPRGDTAAFARCATPQPSAILHASFGYSNLWSAE